MTKPDAESSVEFERLALFALMVLTNLSDATPSTHPHTYETAQDYARAWLEREAAK